MKILKKVNLAVILLAIFTFTIISYSKAAIAKVTTETLNIRKGPSTNSKVIAMISQGVECEVLSEEGDWYKVKYKNYTGYVSKQYVKVSGEISNSENTTTDNSNSETNESTENKSDNKTDNKNVESQNAENNNTATVNSENKQETENSQEAESVQEASSSDPVQLVYKKVLQNTKLKLLPLIHSSEIASLKQNEQVLLLAQMSNWSYVQTSTMSGWVRNDNLTDGKTVTQTEEPTTSTSEVGYINETSVNLRKGAGTSYSIVKVLTLNTKVTIIKEQGDWYEVKVGNTTGYVSKEFVSDTKKVTSRSLTTSRGTTTNTTEETEQKEETTKSVESSSSKETASNDSISKKVSQSSTSNVTTKKETSKNTTTKTDKVADKTTSKSEAKTTSKDASKTTSETTSKNTQTSTSKTNTNSEEKIKGTDIVAYAQKYLGHKYVYGGDGSNGTFDCSGFTMYVFKHFNINLPHGATSQYKSGKGTKIKKQSDLQVGDIVFLTDYETGKGIGHCGIYLGNNNFIHASTTTNTVTISSLNTIYEGRFYAGLRLI